MKNTAFTSSEKRYIYALFGKPLGRPCKFPSDLRPDNIICFLSNREDGPKADYKLDHTISEKFLRFYRLPIKTSRKTFESCYLRRLEQVLEAEEELAELKADYQYALSRYRRLKSW